MYTYSVLKRNDLYLLFINIYICIERIYIFNRIIFKHMCVFGRTHENNIYTYDNKSKILCHNKKKYLLCTPSLYIFKCTQRAYFLCSHGYCGKVIQFNLISIFLRLSAGYMRSHKYTYNITYDVASRVFFYFFNVYIHIFFIER